MCPDLGRIVRDAMQAIIGMFGKGLCALASGTVPDLGRIVRDAVQTIFGVPRNIRGLRVRFLKRCEETSGILMSS